MINSNLIEIDNYLSTPSFFDFLKSLDTESALDSRDDPNFDKRWMTEFSALTSAKIQDEDVQFIDSLREKAFKLSFRASNSTELAAYISDDIELISKSYATGQETCWPITHLWTYYKNGKFPE
ncbi:hypothetical protein [Chitinilyticum litopenaei]|uniref:hypothetical protein n=1 Tax=Chitinilyticum litopenaei TaxID=1121276 RepID=UPI00048B28C7|nr:hypothetical protein [Chitinilyticum litopenaei]